jgi:hypothetical protein
LKYSKTGIILINIEQGSIVEAKAIATFSGLSEEDVTIPSMWTTSNIRIAGVGKRISGARVAFPVKIC